MSFLSVLRERLSLPAICAPMHHVTGPALVAEATKSGIIGVLPRSNASSIEQFDAWLRSIGSALAEHEQQEGIAAAPVAVNLATSMPLDELADNLAVCHRHGVRLVISATGDPTALIERVHDWGGRVFHDVTNLRFAEKAIKAGADGLTCIGAGGGGHSGTISHLSLIPKVRSMFDGIIIMAGAVSTGGAIRAAEMLGADLAYLGTRFIATKESAVDDDYKAMLVSESSTDLLYTRDITGIPANWLVASLRGNGLDPSALPAFHGPLRSYGHLPEGARPWRTIWSAGQGIDLIGDVPSVSVLVERLKDEYEAACRIPPWPPRRP